VEVLKDGRTAFYLKANQIQAVQAEGSYTRILFANNQSCMVKRAIGQWEQRLPEGMFLKASRSLLLDPKCVVKMQSLNRNETEVFLEGRAEPLRLSRLESLRIKQTL
jgi:DNA-binding LytR/AlgR family response regulator